MKDIKNYAIAVLAGLLVLTLSTQNSNGAGSSASAKAIQYDHCLNGFDAGVGGVALAIELCRKYQP